MVKQLKALTRQPARASKAIRDLVGFEELHLYGGAVLAGVGAYLWFPPAGFMVVGLALFYMGWVK